MKMFGIVVSAKKVKDAQDIPGHSFKYFYDDIGNFKTEERNGNTFEYTANNLNQYIQRTVPGVIPVIGEAAEDATVKIHRVNLGEVPEAILTP